MNVHQYFGDNALHQVVKRHTATKRDPSFYSWYKRDPATLFQIEKRTGRVGSNIDLATRAAKFNNFTKVDIDGFKNYLMFKDFGCMTIPIIIGS